MWNSLLKTRILLNRVLTLFAAMSVARRVIGSIYLILGATIKITSFFHQILQNL